MTHWIARTVQRLGGDAIAAKLAGPALVSLTVKVASAALSYLMLVAFARMMSTKDYGQFGLMMNAAIVVSTVCMMGLPVAVVRFWPAHLELGQHALARGFVMSAQKLLALAAGVLVFLGIAFVWAGVGEHFISHAWGAALVALLAALFAFSEFYAGLLRSQDMTSWALIPRDILWRAASPVVAWFVLTFSGALSSGQATLVCIGVLAVLTVLQAIVAWRSTQRLTPGVQSATDWPKWRGPLLPLAGASLLFAMVQQLDVVVIGGLVGAEEAGEYFAAQKTASLLGLVMIAGGMVAAPLMSAAFQGERRDELQRICKLLSVAIAATTFAGFAVLALFGDELLAIFDSTYRDGHVLLMVLAFGYMLDALAGPTAFLMQMTRLENDYLKIMAMVYCMVLALQLALVPIYGPVAAAVATTFGYAVWNGIAIWQLRREVGVDSSLFSFLLPVKPKP